MTTRFLSGQGGGKTLKNLCQFYTQCTVFIISIILWKKAMWLWTFIFLIYNNNHGLSAWSEPLVYKLVVRWSMLEINRFESSQYRTSLPTQILTEIVACVQLLVRVLRWEWFVYMKRRVSDSESGLWLILETLFGHCCREFPLYWCTVVKGQYQVAYSKETTVQSRSLVTLKTLHWEPDSSACSGFTVG